MKNLNKILAEIIGTAALVLMGCGAIIVNDLHGGVLGHIGVSLSFGLVVMIMIYSIGNISGAHLNPAVSLGFYLTKRLELSTMLQYIISQLIGAILAASFLKLTFPTHQTLGMTIPSVNVLSAFIIEVILTALLMFVILNISTGHKEKGIMAGVAVGGTIMLEALVAGPLTGASMNPARSLAPALLTGDFTNIWIYLIAPFVGIMLVYPSCKWIQGKECCNYENMNR